MLTGNVFAGNAANGTGWSGGGGGIYSNGSLTISNNAIISNVADFGGGLYVTGDAMLNSNIVASNQANYGGGLRIYEADITVVNSLVVDNRANSSGSGLHIARSSALLTHMTIAHNSGGDGSGVYATSLSSVYDPTTVSLRNTILVSHSVGITVAAGSTAIVEATLWGDGAWANVVDWGGDGTILTGPSAYNYWGDPAFVDPENGDYHILLASEAVDHGIDAGVTIDIDGQPRPLASGYDLGADEFAYEVYLPALLRQYP